MTQLQETQLPPLVTDRSPELSRAPGPPERNPGLLPNVFTLDLAGAAGEAVRGDGEKCLLAVAIRNAVPDWEAHIAGEHPYLIRLSDSRRFPLHLTPDVIAAIGRFDRGEDPGFGPRTTISFG
jgi:hypothetical protein